MNRVVWNCRTSRSGNIVADAGSASRSRLVQRLLTAAESLPQFIEDLLKTQAVVVAGTEAAAFLSEKQKDQKDPALRPIAHIRAR